MSLILKQGRQNKKRFFTSSINNCIKEVERYSTHVSLLYTNNNDGNAGMRLFFFFSEKDDDTIDARPRPKVGNIVL